MNRIRVLIIEDSRVVREFLEHIISRDPRLEVVGSAASAEEGIRLLPRVQPDVISLDIRLPGMNGFEATRQIMSQRPTPIVVVSASVKAEDLNITMNALKAGALTVVEKPVGTTHEDYEALAQRLCTQLAVMSQVAVIRQRFNRPRPDRHGVNGAAPPRPRFSPGRSDRPFQMLGMVASTGGPRALQQILSNLPADYPLPIALVQHISDCFHEGFVRWLANSCALKVMVAQHLQHLKPGHVYVAPPDHHLTVTNRGFVLNREELVCLERPSGTVLLNSIADCYGGDAIGVVLTGMGNDGAAGLAKLHQAGGYTIAEDESTAVINGMPAAAVQLHAVRESLPLECISPRLMELGLSTERVVTP